MTGSVALHEPAPHYAPTLGFGRGGAGNRTTSKPAPPTTLPSASSANRNSTNSSAAAHSALRNRPFLTGRGGAGNVRPAEDERRLFSFDEELAREEHWRGRLNSEAVGGNHNSNNSNRVPVYHIGRGGQGNAVHVSADRGSTASSNTRRGSNSSGSDAGSAKKGVSGWVKGLSRRS